jgi:hypothetical protein
LGASADAAGKRARAEKRASAERQGELFMMRLDGFDGC